MKREDIIPRGNIQKVRRNLFGSPTQEDRDQFTKLYEEQMEKDRQVKISTFQAFKLLLFGTFY